MIDHSDKNLDYALRAIQHPQLRETDEFLQWINISGNKELFLELMACKEAVIRENLERKRRVRSRMYIGAAAFTAAGPCRISAGFSDSFVISDYFPANGTTHTALCCNH